MPGLLHRYCREATMTDQSRRPSGLANDFFVGAQSQFYGRGEAAEELSAAVAAREEKTARLREARLAKDRRDLIVAAAAKMNKKSVSR